MTPDNPKDSPTDLLRELETLQRVLDDAAGDQVGNGLNIPVLDPMDDIPVLNDLFSGDDIPVLKAVPRRSATVTQLPVQKTAPAAAQEEAPAEISQPEPIASLPADEDDDILPATQAAAAEATPALMPAAGVLANEAPGSEVSANAAATNVAPTNVAPTNVAPTKTSSNPFLPQAILDRLAQEREAAQQSAQEAHRTMQRVMEQKQARAQQALAGMGKTLTQVQKDALIEQLIAEMLPAITERLREKLKHSLNL